MTGVVVRAGFLRSLPGVVGADRAVQRVSLSSTEKGSPAAVVCYPRKTAAAHAVAARVVDALYYAHPQREQEHQEGDAAATEPRLCEEEPLDWKALTAQAVNGTVATIPTASPTTTITTKESTKQPDIQHDKREPTKTAAVVDDNKAADGEGSSMAAASSPQQQQQPQQQHPVVELTNLYRSLLGIEKAPSSLNDLMQVEMVRHAGMGNLWTAQFVCPLSADTGGDRTFMSGTLRPTHAEQELGVVDQEVFDSISLVQDHQPKVFYKVKKLAIRAAAARALDVLRLEREGVLEPRLCEEDPLMEDEGGDLSQTTLMDTTTGTSTATTRTETDPSDAGTDTRPENQTAFADSMGAMGTTTILETDRMDNGNDDHSTNEEFGLVGASTVVLAEEDGLMDPDEKILGVPDNISDEPLVTPISLPAAVVNTSEEEAWLTAWNPDIDGTNENDNDDDESWIVHYNASPKTDVQKEQESPAMRVLSSLAERFYPGGGSSKSMGVDATTMEPVTPSVGAGSVLVQSEEDRIRMVEQEALSWVHSVGHKKAESTLHGIELPQSISSSAVYIAKSYLASLADANLSSTGPNTFVSGSPTAIEGTASKILNVLWDAKDDKVAPDTHVYNLYLFCLEGFDPVTKAMKAESIVQRMKNQARLRGHVPPPPNVATYNALLHIWAQVGGASGRYSKLDESFEPNRDSFLAILSSSSYAENEQATKQQQQPQAKSTKRQRKQITTTTSGDTETNSSSNSGSSSSSSNVFDLEFAKQVLERMKTLYQETGNESFQPDTQIFNAPMPWSGGLIWNETRPNTRRIPWDDHRALYKNGFRQPPTETSDSETQEETTSTSDADDETKPESPDALVRNAERLEEWIQYMDEYEAKPNIETFEALIQAWVRTGTRQGLEKAEAVIEERILPSSVPLRIQTLHPILAAWLHVRDEQSPSKLLKWIECLRSQDEATRDALQRDLRFLCLELATILLQMGVNDRKRMDLETPPWSSSDTEKLDDENSDDVVVKEESDVNGETTESDKDSHAIDNEEKREDNAMALLELLASASSPKDSVEPPVEAELTTDSTASHTISEDASTVDDTDPLELPQRCSILFKKLADQIDEAPVEEHSTLLPLLASPAMLTLTAWGRSGMHVSSGAASCQTVLNAMVDVLDVYENVLRNVAVKEAENMEISGGRLSEELRSVVAGAHEVFYCMVEQMHDIAVLYRQCNPETVSKENADILQPHLVRLEQMCRRLEEFREIGVAGIENERSSKLVFADRYDYHFSSLLSNTPSPNESHSSFPWKILEMLDSMPCHTLSKTDVADIVRFTLFLKDVVRSGGVKKGRKLDESLDAVLKRVLPAKRPKRGGHRQGIDPTRSSSTHGESKSGGAQSSYRRSGKGGGSESARTARPRRPRRRLANPQSRSHA